VLIEKEANAEPHYAIASFALNAAKGWRGESYGVSLGLRWAPEFEGHDAKSH